MAITKEQVKQIAELSRLELNEQEIKKYQHQLGQILDYFEKLKQVKTDDVETADGGTRDLFNIWRDDEQEIRNQKLETRELIEMAPERERGMVKVKRVLN